MRNLDSFRCWRCTLCPCKVRSKFLINFWNRTILLCIPCTCFGQFLCPSSGVFHCTHSNGTCHTACEQDKNGTSWSCSQAVWHTPLLCVQWKTPDGGQRNCPKHVDFYFKNKFDKWVHLVGFIIRIYHDARSPERQIKITRKLENKDSNTEHSFEVTGLQEIKTECYVTIR